MSDIPTSFEPLRRQLLAAADAFSTRAQPLAAILDGLVNDVDRACREPLEIFPVCHHSPSSAVQMVRRLRERPPRAIYMECCEDLAPLLPGLCDCKLPVALQAFAPQSEVFPPDWSPLNLVCPLTEFSAEFQAIAFSLQNSASELVLVDRSADHVFQWIPREDGGVETYVPGDPDADDEDAAMHGSAVGVEIGSLVPSFEDFRHFLLKNARVQHFSEWWDQYVEESIIDGDYSAYRQVMFLVGSLFRRLGTRKREREQDELRERYMWTRIKQHLKQCKIEPRDAVYVCGAAHSASYVPEFGIESDTAWEIPPASGTTWHYGLLPSCYSAISHQFGHPRGAVTLAEARWKKSMNRQGVRGFVLAKTAETAKGKSTATVVSATSKRGRNKVIDASPTASGRGEPSKPNGAQRPEADAQSHPLLNYLQKPPALVEADEEDLVQNCVRIVEMARSNGYLATTADSIAVYQTALLLAHLRNRRHPTPYDFRDAAVTCIEKDVVPGKRSVSRLCDIMLGGDKIGRIGYESMPPLAQDVYNRLEELPIKLDARTIQRALLDFRKTPELIPCSDLLWKLWYLLPEGVIRPIMGQRQLGHVPVQESWDIAIGKHQGAVIQLGYEGVTVEHVLERRLKKVAFGPDSRTSNALDAAEKGLLFLKSERLTQELGERAIALLVTEPDVQQAGEIHTRITRLIHYYRTTPDGLPRWVQQFVTAGYTHYATLLPNAFADRGVRPEDLAAMLQFVFTLESLALSLGCERSQLVIAIKQAETVTNDHPKLALLWSAQCVLQLLDISSLRDRFDRLLDNELTYTALPDYLGGFLLALAFTPLVGSFTVELLSKAFERLPDRLLMPWLPKLLMMLRPHAATVLPALMKDAAALYPTSLDALSAWQPPWDRSKGRSAVVLSTSDSLRADVRPRRNLSERQVAVNNLLKTFPATVSALAALFGLSIEWREGDCSESAVENGTPLDGGNAGNELVNSVPGTTPRQEAVREFLRNHGAVVTAVAKSLGAV